jgi:hypothetical protein
LGPLGISGWCSRWFRRRGRLGIGRSHRDRVHGHRLFGLLPASGDGGEHQNNDQGQEQ